MSVLATGKIEARGVQKIFRDEQTHRQVMAIGQLDLSIAEKEFAVVIGPSGCGKSTFLYMVAGFEKPTRGTVLLNGRPVEKPGPDRGLVFQEFVLYPWRTVIKNVSFGLELNGVADREARARAQHFVELVGLGGFEDAYPHQLSGGMKQRVAIARALAYDPEVLLMDEPFGALDAQTKSFMIQDLQRVWEEADKTIIFVTHSVKEAILLADRIYVFGARPSHLKAVVPVDMARPRDPSSARVTELERQLVDLLRDEVAQMMRVDQTSPARS